MPRTLANRVASRFALIAAITIAVASGSLLRTAKFNTISSEVEQIHEVVECLKDLITLVGDAESGQRGFLLTGGRDGYLKPYDNATESCGRKIKELDALAVKFPEEQRRLVEELKPLISQKFSELDETIRLHRSGDLDGALGLVKTDKGERLMTEIRRIVAKLYGYEQTRLAEIVRDASLLRTLSFVLSLVSAVLTVSMLIAVYFVVGREMKERAQAERELARARDAAEAASRAKDDFMANVSHEIRTPMNAILGMTTLTLGTDLSAGNRENLQIVKSASDTLLAIIDDLLDFSEMEAGELNLDPVEFGLRDHLVDTLSLFGLRASEKGLELDCRVDPCAPDCLVGDAKRLRQILVNLVGNAIKFTEYGKVVMDVELMSGPPGVLGLHFRVTDTGIGISPDQQDLVFSPFAQVDGSKTRLYGGTGLGLTISSKLVGLMGGRIWVESEPFSGSTFHFTANFLAAAAEPTGPRPDPSRERSPARALRILMAEDNPFNQRVAVLLLAKSGHAVTIAVDGREAVEVLASRPFDLVLMDLQMPIMDGLQATIAIRLAEVGTPDHVPIIALTSDAMRQDEDRCLAAGMDGFLTKPIDEEKLLRAIDKCLQLGRQANQEGAEGPEVERVESPDPMDLAAALGRVDGDRAFLGEMVALFLAGSPGLMSQIRDAIAEGDPASLVDPAHNLKNWASCFVANKTFTALARLEALGRAGTLAAAGAAFTALERDFERLTLALAQSIPEPLTPEGEGALLAVGHEYRSPPCTL